MAREGMTEQREWRWRAWTARLVALVFVLQSVGLFLAPGRPAAFPAGASAMAMADCPHHHPGGHHHHGQGDDSSDSCPMCQSLGCALASAATPAFVLRVEERLIVLVALPAPQWSPRTAPLPTPPARGPPSLV